jgi:predicted alpha/beta-fold hydrolase
VGSHDTKPMLITLHGLSGGSHEIYLRHVLQPLVEQQSHGNNGGWEAIVVNSRGCAMSKITTGILYNARATWDLRQTVKWCREMYPNRPLYAIGYSLGANILTNVRRSITLLNQRHVLFSNLGVSCSCSIWVKRAMRANCKLLSSVRTHGSSRSPVLPCSVLGWV